MFSIFWIYFTKWTLFMNIIFETILYEIMLHMMLNAKESIFYEIENIQQWFFRIYTIQNEQNSGLKPVRNYLYFTKWSIFKSDFTECILYEMTNNKLWLFRIYPLRSDQYKWVTSLLRIYTYFTKWACSLMLVYITPFHTVPCRFPFRKVYIWGYLLTSYHFVISPFRKL